MKSEIDRLREEAGWLLKVSAETAAFGLAYELHSWVVSLGSQYACMELLSAEVISLADGSLTGREPFGLAPVSAIATRLEASITAQLAIITKNVFRLGEAFGGIPEDVKGFYVQRPSDVDEYKAAVAAIIDAVEAECTVDRLNLRMTEKLVTDKDSYDWSLRRWAKEMGSSTKTVSQTRCWRVVLPRKVGRKRGGRRKQQA